MTRLFSSAAIVLALSALVLPACGNKDPYTIKPQRRGVEGESCLHANDCEKGYACIADVCRLKDFPLVDSGKECRLIECARAEDCCELPAVCPDLLRSCEGGDDSACQQFEQSCQCLQACAAGRCIPFTPCSSDGECSSNICEQGRCVDCVAERDCESDEICAGNFCQPRCSSKYDCPFFSECQNGQCTNVGCSTDRECMADDQDVRGRCVERECQRACENDRECNEASDYEFRACVAGFCQSVGCETEEECRIRLDLEPGTRQRAACQ